MNKVPNQAWWSTMGFHKPEPAHETDYADMLRRSLADRFHDVADGSCFVVVRERLAYQP